MTTAIIWDYLQDLDTKQCRKRCFKLEDQFFSRCVVGVGKTSGNGEQMLVIHGELQAISNLNGNLSYRSWKVKLTSGNTQAKEDGTILICLKLETATSLTMKHSLISLFGVF